MAQKRESACRGGHLCPPFDLVCPMADDVILSAAKNLFGDGYKRFFAQNDNLITRRISRFKSRTKEISRFRRSENRMYVTTQKDIDAGISGAVSKPNRSPAERVRFGKEERRNE